MGFAVKYAACLDAEWKLVARQSTKGSVIANVVLVLSEQILYYIVVHYVASALLWQKSCLQ